MAIPIPKLPKTLSARLFGHISILQKAAKEHNVSLYMGLYKKHIDFYEETKSNTFKIRMVNVNTIMTRDKDFYSEVLGAKQADFTNSIAFKKVFGYYFPHNIFVPDGEEWQKIRKLLTKALNKTSYELIVPSIVNNVLYAFETKNEEGRTPTEKSDQGIKGDNLANRMKTYDFISRVTFDAFHDLVYEWNPQSL
eukprot:CAMPEP_0170529484 /NCGR_PEP_ID=MMETSP0209-20121228/24478_1 /TAXON_ID=665100 ORGANISM="Litonotus pictus, Strain P1" /NCGR_SAMPLE_ID=MMETSP0209 /ASSEMBLY_ACC=CAM_ASM_000301 /LENGTH=193 /DNA_ID=CAMNT_0010821507 /DNA_START=12 /DNA_END=590 /DNA_ORIENTATION=-